MGTALAVLMSCIGKAPTYSVSESDSETETGAPIGDSGDTGAIPEDTGSVVDTADTDDSDTDPSDPDLVTSSDSIYDIFDSGSLEQLSGAAATGNADGDTYVTAVGQYLGALTSGLTGSDNQNSYGNYNVTIFGDTSTYDFDNGWTSEVGYMAIAAGHISDSVASAPDATSLIDNTYDISGELDLSVPYMLVGVNILRDAGGNVVSAASTITYYGAEYYANNLHTMMYAGRGQDVTITASYSGSTAQFTDSAELASAEAGAENLLNGMDYLAGTPAEYSIRGNETD